MADEAKKKVVKVKTVDRREIKPKKASLVLKAKQQAKVDAEKIKKSNEKLAVAKSIAAKALADEESMKNEVTVAVEVGGDDRVEEIEKMQVGDKYKLSITAKDMLGAGCHLGHKSAKTNPHFKQYIYATKDKMEILDLIQTEKMLHRACNYIYGLVRSGKKIVLVGTKRQAREIVRKVALESGVPYVTDRWLGGTISNWDEMYKNIRKLADFKDGLEKDKFANLTKKEVSLIRKDVARLERMVGGLSGLDKMFEAMIVVDAGFEKTALREATGRKVTTLGIADNDSDPRAVDFLIPTNDDSVKSVVLIVEEIGRAISEARKK